VRRREFIRLIYGAAAVWPVGVHAQSAARIARVGYLTLLSPSSVDDAFAEGLHHLGWIEGQNILIERRFGAGNIERLKKSAAELVEIKVDIIVAIATAATEAAKAATTSTPIVFAATGDPIGQGFVASLARPGGNLTGTSFDAGPEIPTKQLQLLIEMAPNVSRVAILWNPVLALLIFTGNFSRTQRRRCTCVFNPKKRRTSKISNPPSTPWFGSTPTRLSSCRMPLCRLIEQLLRDSLPSIDFPHYTDTTYTQRRAG
jgi:hypothetical protein